MYWVSFHRGLPQCILRIRDVNMCVHQSQVFLRWLALGAVFISSTSPAVCVCETVVFDIHIKTQTVPPEPKNLLQCFQIRYHCCHEKQNPDRLFMTYLPSWLHVCQEIIKKKKKTHTHNEDRVFIVTFHLCVCVFNMLWMQQTDSGKNDVKCVSTTLLDPHRGSWPPVLSARPSLLSPHLQ